MRPTILAVLLILTIPGNALENQAGTASAEFLNLGAGARSLGMGDAFTAVAEGPDAAYWNPAGLAYMPHIAAAYTRTERPAGVHHDFAAMAFPLPAPHGTLAVSLIRLSQDKLTLVDASNQEHGSFAPHSEALALSYARTDGFGVNTDFSDFTIRSKKMARFSEDSWPQIAGGLTAKLIQEDLGTRRAATFAFDGGAIYRPADIEGLSLAAAFRNVGKGLRFISRSAPLPWEIAAGAAFDAHVDDWRLLPALEGAFPYAGNPYGKLGFEASHPVGRGLRAALRLGYNSRTVPDLGPISGMTAGVGLRIGGLSFDSAFQPLAVLGESLRIGVGWEF